jgi:tRNA pseudouridine55 synthase
MVRRRDADLPDLSGLLVIDKPVGLTSHDVVARVRRMTGMKRVGHAGTLDPFATGVLIVAVGRATRLLQYVQDSDKGYLATNVLGTETDSCDVDGAVVRRIPLEHWPSREAVEACLASFVGTIDQVPPIYSAIKIGGQKLYEFARAGKTVDIPSRQVQIHGLELVAYDPPELSIGVWCGKGTYIRSLARDIGQSLGTTAYCQTLRRTNTGGFCLADSWSLEDLADIDVQARWPEIALAPDAAVESLPAVVLGGVDTVAWYHGRPVHLSDVAVVPGALYRIYAADGSFAGLGAVTDERQVRPALVFPAMGETPEDLLGSVEAGDSVVHEDIDR